MNVPPIVGNDVVDLNGIADGLGSSNVAFTARVCSPSEREFLSHSLRPAAHLWYLWSAKETAFKILQRLEPRLAFRHARFVVDVDSGLVTVADNRIVVVWSEESRCLTCWGYLELNHRPPAISTAVAERREICIEPDDTLSPREQLSVSSTESLKVRLLAKRLIARSLGLDQSQLEVVRHRVTTSFSGWSPPHVYYRGKPMSDVCISLAHHGIFLGCAVAVQ